MLKRGRSIVVVGIWLAIAVVSATQNRVAFASRGHPAPFGPLLLDSILEWGSCGVFTPIVVWLVARYPVVRRPLLHVPIQLAAISVLVAAKFALQLGILSPLVGLPAPPVLETITRHFVGEAIAFAALFAVVHAVRFYARLRDEQLQGLALRAELADSRLDALVNKIEPHFLFNTLQAISTLLQRDPRAADAMISGLSDLLRDLLRSDAPREVPLAFELETARRYLDIMIIRFGDRLTLSIEATGDVERALVPRLVLQPLLENALRHGVASTTGPATLEVHVRRRADRLEIAVADDGRAESSAPGNGVGLANTRARLAQLYGETARLETSKPVAGGFRVTLDLPFRIAP